MDVLCSVDRCTVPPTDFVSGKAGAYTVAVPVCSDHHTIISRVRRFRDHTVTAVTPTDLHGEHPPLESSDG